MIPGAELLLDLDKDAPLDLLRTHLGRAGRAVLIEAASPEGCGWIGGRAHSLVVPLASTRAPAPPALPRHTAVIHRDHGMPPGTSPWLCAELFVHPDVQDQALARLPRLLASFAADTRWWFERHAEPEPLLRLRIALLGADEFGPAAQALGTWAAGLLTNGLLRDLRLTTLALRRRERGARVGRWWRPSACSTPTRRSSSLSSAHATPSARRRWPPRTSPRSRSVSPAPRGTQCTDSPARPAPAPPQVPRGLRAEAVRLADPKDDFAALHTALAARVFSHELYWSSMAKADEDALAAIVELSGLRRGTMPAHLLDDLMTSAKTSQAQLAQVLA